MKPKADFRSQFRMSLYFSFGLLFFAQPLGATPKLPTSDTSYEIPSEDESYKYYLGVSDATDSVKDGMTETFDQAAQEAIRENFGVFTQIETDSYATEKENQVLRRFKQQSGEIALKGFEKIDSKVIKDSTTSKYQVQALYRYSKIAIKQELARLDSKEDSPTKADPGISVIGSLDNEALGGLRVSTKPPAASISLNDEPYLKSPIDIVNQIPPGKYTLKIDHPHFDTVTEEILIQANRTTKISKVLKPAHGRLSLSSTPPGAEVRINGKLVGKTPLVKHKLLAGVAMRVDLSHKNAYGMSLHAYSVEKDQLREESLEMKPKPGSILLSIKAPRAEVSIDGVTQPLRQRRFRLPAGTHKLEVTAPGYTMLVKDLEVKSDRTMTEVIELEKEVPQTKNSDQRSPSFEYLPPVVPGIPLSSRFYFTLGLNIEMISSPLVGRSGSFKGGSINSSETNNDFNQAYLSPLVDLELGFKGGIAFGVSSGVIRKEIGGESLGGGRLNVPRISEANRIKLGVKYNFDSKNGNHFQVGGESETMDAEVATTLSYRTGVYPNTFTTRTLARLTGRGLYLGWVSRSDATLISLKIGVMDYTFDHMYFKATQCIFVRLGVSFDLWRGSHR